jgi:hypothetical protein
MKDPREFDDGGWRMELAAPPQQPPFIRQTPVGLELAKDLTFGEWRAIAASFGTALQSAAWCIGDWLVYGERRWGRQLLLEGEDFDPAMPSRIPSHVFDEAVAATGLDRQTLSNYANVCRKIPMADRRVHVSFGHHRVLAPLPPAKRLAWLSLLDSESKSALPTVKRLSLSVRAAEDKPRIVTDEEIQERGERQAGHDNYIPHLTRLLTVLRNTVPEMDEDQLAALRADTAPLLRILRAL